LWGMQIAKFVRNRTVSDGPGNPHSLKPPAILQPTSKRVIAWKILENFVDLGLQPQSGRLIHSCVVRYASKEALIYSVFHWPIFCSRAYNGKRLDLSRNFVVLRMPAHFFSYSGRNLAVRAQ
jgi:hypothetical protein